MHCPPTIVIDAGSSSTRLGMGGNSAPSTEFPTAVGVPRHPGVTAAMLNQPTGLFAGADARDVGGLLTSRPPIVDGMVKDWESLEALLHHSFYMALGMCPEDYPVLWTESPMQSKRDREKVVELLLERFNSPGVGMSNALVASLFARGRTTGVVVDSGSSRTSIGTVWEGYCQPHSLRSECTGGNSVTAFLRHMLRTNGFPFSTASDTEMLEEIKAKGCYVAESLGPELVYAEESTTVGRFFTMPDGARIYVNKERFVAPEMMFTPSVLTNSWRRNSKSMSLSGGSFASPFCAATATASGDHARLSSSHAANVDSSMLEKTGAFPDLSDTSKSAGIHNGNRDFHGLGWHDVILDTITHQDSLLRPEYYANIVLSGGNTLFPNLEERLYHELKHALDGGTGSAPRIHCDASPCRQYNNWLGGSIASTLGTFSAQLLSKTEYDEAGANAIHCKA